MEINRTMLFHSVWESLYTIHGVAGLPSILSACFWVVSSMSHFNHVRLSVESFRQRVRAVPYILLLNQWLKERGIKYIGIFCVMAERTREDVTEQVLARRVGVSETTRKRNRLLPVYLRVRKNTLFSPRLVN